MGLHMVICFLKYYLCKKGLVSVIEKIKFPIQYQNSYFKLIYAWGDIIFQTPSNVSDDFVTLGMNFKDDQCPELAKY